MSATIYEVKFTLSGIVFRTIVKALSPARAVIAVRNGLTKAGVKDAAEAMESYSAHSLHIAEDVEGMVASQNRFAAASSMPEGDSSPADNTREQNESITLEYCEANCAYAVSKEGIVTEYFPTKKEAEAYANELAQEGVDGKKAAPRP